MSVLRELPPPLSCSPDPSAQIELVRLPHAYTELHAQVSSSTTSSNSNTSGGGGEEGNGVLGGAGAGRVGHPAVCLVCGEVLDASGRGQCTRHARECGCGVGLFFLLQVGVMLVVRARWSHAFVRMSVSRTSSSTDVSSEQAEPLMEGQGLVCAVGLLVPGSGQFVCLTLVCWG